MSNKNKLRQEFNAHIREEYIKQHPYCEYCGEPTLAAHVHHIFPLSKGGDNREVNLIALCTECHGKIHGRNLNYTELQKEGLRRAQASGIVFGRPELVKPDNWEEVMQDWKAGNITAKKAMELTGLKRTSFYKLAKKEGL